MPNVKKNRNAGGMKFPYTEKGIAQAKSYSMQSGGKVKLDKIEMGEMVSKYKHGGMVPNRPNPMGGGPNVPLRRVAPRPPGQFAPQGFGAINWQDAPHYGPHRGYPISPSISNELEPGETSPLPPGAGMRPPLRPNLYGHGGKVMSPAQRMAIANRIAKMMHGGKIKNKKGK